MENRWFTLALVLLAALLRGAQCQQSSYQGGAAANLTVVGTVFCDACSSSSFSNHSYFLPGTTSLLSMHIHNFLFPLPSYSSENHKYALLHAHTSVGFSLLSYLITSYIENCSLETENSVFFSDLSFFYPWNFLLYVSNDCGRYKRKETTCIP